MPTLPPKPEENALFYAYRDHRTVIGVLGVTLPFVLMGGGWLIFQTDLRDSLSSYYYTGMRDVFVGSLWVIGLSLFAYKGYERIDDRLGNLACIFALGTSLFPTAPLVDPSPTAQLIGNIHLFFAVLLFLTLSYFSFFLFTRNDTPNPSPGKALRNHIYRICGVTMFLCIVLMGVSVGLPTETRQVLQNINPIFWLETVMIFAFGFSWLIKGKDARQFVQRFRQPTQPPERAPATTKESQAHKAGHDPAPQQKP